MHIGFHLSDIPIASRHPENSCQPKSFGLHNPSKLAFLAQSHEMPKKWGLMVPLIMRHAELHRFRLQDKKIISFIHVIAHIDFLTSRSFGIRVCDLYFRSFGIDVRIVERFGYTQSIIDWADVIMTAGGDGTFLLGASRIKSLQKPIIGINTDLVR